MKEKIIKLSEADKAYAKALEKSVKNLTDDEKRQAVLLASMSEGAKDAIPDIISWDEIEEALMESEKKLMEFQKQFPCRIPGIEYPEE
jgi:hypothetical protein